MAYPKFRLTNTEISVLFETELLPYAEVVEVPKRDAGMRWCRDPDDDRFTRCAKAGKCAWLVSGDDDLLSLKKVGKTTIIPPAEFMAILGA